MSNYKEDGFLKEHIEKGWVKYTSELEGYEYFIKVFGEKLVMFDNFSVSPFVVSEEKIEDENFLETLELVYSTNEIPHGLNREMKNIGDYVSKEAYNEVKEVFDYHFGD